MSCRSKPKNDDQQEDKDKDDENEDDEHEFLIKKVEERLMENIPERDEGDEYDYDSWKNIPALFLRCYIKNPYWADKIKSAALGWEFNHKGGPAWRMSDYSNLAALLSTSVMQE